MKQGIDYGMGLTNVDPKTGIRYGVISQNEVLQSWADSSEPYYPEVCGYCGNKADNFSWEGFICASCGKENTEDELSDLTEPGSWYIDNDEYTAESDEHGDIFITKSPYYTKCSFCSPCAPGAGYLMEYHDKGIKAYCFGHDWFDEGKAPYPIYSVETNKQKD